MKIGDGRGFSMKSKGGNLTGQMPKIRQGHRQAEQIRYKDQDRRLNSGSGDSLGAQTKSRDWTYS